MSNGCQMCQPLAKFTNKSLFQAVTQDTVGYSFFLPLICLLSLPQAPSSIRMTLHFYHLDLIWWLFTYGLTSSLRSSRWTSQETVACGERGMHSRKVLLFSVAYTTLSSVTSSSSEKRDHLKGCERKKLKAVSLQITATQKEFTCRFSLCGSCV